MLFRKSKTNLNFYNFRFGWNSAQELSAPPHSVCACEIEKTGVRACTYTHHFAVCRLVMCIFSVLLLLRCVFPLLFVPQSGYSRIGVSGCCCCVDILCMSVLKGSKIPTERKIRLSFNDRFSFERVTETGILN